RTKLNVLMTRFRLRTPMATGFEIDIELDAPTIARMVPMKSKRRGGFSATNDEEACLHLTKPPTRLRSATARQDALPASGRCLSQPRLPYKIFHPRQPVRI